MVFLDKNFDDEIKEEVDQEINEIMENQEVDLEEAEKIKEVMDETGLDEDEAAELADEL